MEKSWDDTEKIVSDIICKKLRIQETLHIERAHRVGKQMSKRHDKSKNRPRPIIAKFTYWKQKRKVLRAARELKLEGVQFYPDFAKRTLQRRASQIPKLLEERKKGKVAYFVMDQLIVKDKPPDINHLTWIVVETESRNVIIIPIVPLYLIFTADIWSISLFVNYFMFCSNTNDE